MKPILLDFPDELTSSRLLLRCPRSGDGAAVCEAINESIDQLKPWTNWATTEQKIEDVEESARIAQVDFLLRKDLRFHIYQKDTGMFVGGTGLHRIDWRIPRFEIGYWCRSSLQGRGYITEAVQRIETFAFEDLGAQRLELRIDPDNTKSLKIPRKLGFMEESRQKHTMRSPTKELRDMIVFVKLPEQR